MYSTLSSLLANLSIFFISDGINQKPKDIQKTETLQTILRQKLTALQTDLAK